MGGLCLPVRRSGEIRMNSIEMCMSLVLSLSLLLLQLGRRLLRCFCKCALLLLLLLLLLYHQVYSRGLTRRVPVTNGYPPILFGGKYPNTRGYLGPGCSRVLGPGYLGTRFYPGNPGGGNLSPPKLLIRSLSIVAFLFVCRKFELEVRSTELWELSPSPSVEVRPLDAGLLECCCVYRSY